jgi:transcriptional regulator with XRE-family HTH domain
MENMNFGRILKKMREDKGLSQNQLAKLADLTSSAISQFESNLRKPSFEALISLSKVLDISCDYLLGIKNDTDKLPEDLKNSEYIALFRKVTNLPKDKIRQVDKIIDAIHPPEEEK